MPRAARRSLLQEVLGLSRAATGRAISGTFPPLWGPHSFNNGAGMAHIDRMTGFIRYNMPQNAPGTLSLAQAYDVAAFVLSHPRPHFRKNALRDDASAPGQVLLKPVGFMAP